METINGEARQEVAVLVERLTGCQNLRRLDNERLLLWQQTMETRMVRVEESIGNMRTASLDRTSKIFVGVLVLLGPVLVVLLQYVLK